MPTATEQEKHFKSVALAAARAADDKKGDEIRLLHLKNVSEIADYLLIVTVTSAPHMGAVEEALRIALKSQGETLNHRDGKQSDIWRVLDYGGLLVHLMVPKAREFYALDKLFHEAKPVRWTPPAAKQNPATKKKANATAKKALKKKPAKKKAQTKKKAVKKRSAAGG